MSLFIWVCPGQCEQRLRMFPGRAFSGVGGQLPWMGNLQRLILGWPKPPLPHLGSSGRLVGLLQVKRSVPAPLRRAQPWPFFRELQTSLWESCKSSHSFLERGGALILFLLLAQGSVSSYYGPECTRHKREVAQRSFLSVSATSNRFSLTHPWHG